MLQRAPLPVARSARPVSLAHASGTTGSITTFCPAGTFATIQSRASWRVSARASTTSLWIANTSPCAHSSTPAAAAAQAGRGAARARSSAQLASRTAP